MGDLEARESIDISVTKMLHWLVDRGHVKRVDHASALEHLRREGVTEEMKASLGVSERLEIEEKYADEDGCWDYHAVCSAMQMMDRARVGSQGELEETSTRTSVLGASSSIFSALAVKVGAKFGDAWSKVKFSYERDGLHLTEAAMTLERATNHEIPFLQKESVRILKQLQDCDRREHDVRRSGAAANKAYESACAAVGVSQGAARCRGGGGFDRQLDMVTVSLKTSYEKAASMARSEEVRSALAHYERWMVFAHRAQVDAHSFPDLRALQAFMDDDTIEANKVNNLTSIEDKVQPADITSQVEAADEHSGIDWDISVVSEDVQCASREEESVRQNRPDVDAIDWNVDMSCVSLEEPGQSPPETEINWDVQVIEEDLASAELPDQTTGRAPFYMRLENVEFRNGVLRDLAELRAFLRQQATQFRNAEKSMITLSMASPEIAQYGEDLIVQAIQMIDACTHEVSSDDTRRMLLLATSKSYRSRLVAELERKANAHEKTKRCLLELDEKRKELRRLSHINAKKLDRLKQRLRNVKYRTEEMLSKHYDGRPVNIIGQVNTFLEQKSS